MARLYQAWADAAQRSEWLPDPDINIATRNKSLRVTWIDGKTNVEVSFYSKPSGKSLVAPGLARR